MNCAVHTDTQAAAFCRNCGKALCETCKRDVMGAIYCEPCIAARLQSAPPPPVQPGVVAAPRTVPGAPNPGIAAFLGFLPGVGAMYNGQFVKAFIHVAFFALSIMATSSLNGWFWPLIPFSVFYMVFDAYKTAEAKQMGLPAPDPLGLDKMFGIQESQPAPGSGFAATSAVPGGVTPSSTAPASSPESTIPSAPAYAPPPQGDLIAGAPTGAIVLIVLGVLFLFRNLFELHRIWPIFLIALGLWLAFKRTIQRG
jgi:TM2 domain-containing membrane protein YozV